RTYCSRSTCGRRGWKVFRSGRALWQVGPKAKRGRLARHNQYYPSSNLKRTLTSLDRSQPEIGRTEQGCAESPGTSVVVDDKEDLTPFKRDCTPSEESVGGLESVVSLLPVGGKDENEDGAKEDENG